MLAIGSGQIPVIDERLDRVDKKVEIQIPPPTAELRMLERRILGEPFTSHVRYADYDRVQPVEAYLGHGNVHVPRSGKARGGIEEILPVVHVDDRILAVSGRVSAGQRNEEVSLVVELGTVDTLDLLDGAERIIRAFAPTAQEIR